MHYLLRNLRAISVTDGSVLLTWSPGDDDDNVVLRNDPNVQYEIYYKAITENSSNAAVFESDKVRNCLACCLKTWSSAQWPKIEGTLFWVNMAICCAPANTTVSLHCNVWAMDQNRFLVFLQQMPFLQVAKEIVDLQSKLSSQLDVIITFHPVQ